MMKLRSALEEPAANDTVVPTAHKEPQRVCGSVDTTTQPCACTAAQQT